jgi:predicted Zn-dependent peptidase
MRLYIKTPFYENNKYIPHLLEHCVLFSPEIKHFLYTYNEVYAYASTGYTTFEFDNATPLESLVKTIQNAITPANIPLQKKILKSEYENSSSGQKLYEKTLQKIMKNPNIKTNGCQKVSMKEIIQYHKKWYQKEHMIVFDEASTNILNR